MKFIWAIIGGLLLAAGVLLSGFGAGSGAGEGTRSGRDDRGGRPAADRSDRAGEVATPVVETIQELAEKAADDEDRITAKTWVLGGDDTLPELARRRYGDERLWRRIVDANPRLAAGEVELGDEILLPDLEDIPDPVIDAAALVADLDDGRADRDVDEPARTARPVIEVPEGAPELTLGIDREIPDATVEPGRLVKVDDSIVADGQFRIQGAGTEADPYRVSWELLSSAADGYRPSLGERAMPQRIAALDGAWVELDGYVAFPLGGADTSELLVMLNQWDGCCIGIPPTPYDAIEVSLTDAVPPAERHAISFGSLKGRLVVSPYLVENWLVGLYLMDDATVRFES